MVVLTIYEAIAIAVLFFVYKNTGFELFEMEIGVAVPIFNRKHLTGSMIQLYLYSTK